LITALVILVGRVVALVLTRRRPLPLAIDLQEFEACSRCGHESGRHRSPDITNEDVNWWVTLEMADRPPDIPFGLMPCAECVCDDFQF
jgi:hypothetical protein